MTRLAPAHVRPCPECSAGHHGNCDGTAWDDNLDTPVTCPCMEADPRQHLTVEA